MIIEKHPLPEMEDFYFDSERQFLEFNKIIPYEKNPSQKIYSPRFLGIIQSIGSQIDSMFKILTDSLSMSIKTKTFPNYYVALNRKKMLSFQKVNFSLTHRTFQPFKLKNPGWWTAYNKTKHNLPFGAYEVKLNHIVEALAALFILHDLAWTREILTDYSIDFPDDYRTKSTFLDVKNWRDEEFERKHNLQSDNTDSYFIKSSLFSRVTYFRPK